MRKSSRGSASGGGSSTSSCVRGIARRTSTTRSLGGGAPSTIRPAGAAITTTTGRSAVNACDDPGSDHSPKSIAAVASVGSSPRAVSPATTSRASSPREATRPRSTVAGASPRIPMRLSGVGSVGRERRHLRDLSAVAVDHREPVVRVEGDDRGAARAHPVDLERRVRRAQSGEEELRAGGLDRHRLRLRGRLLRLVLIGLLHQLLRQLALALRRRASSPRSPRNGGCTTGSSSPGRRSRAGRPCRRTGGGPRSSGPSPSRPSRRGGTARAPCRACSPNRRTRGASCPRRGRRSSPPRT